MKIKYLAKIFNPKDLIFVPQKKTIVIIEFDYHAEVLLNSLLILQALPYNICLFTTTKIWDRISSSGKLIEITVFEVHNQRDVKRLIKENLQIINSSHAIIFNTLASHFKLFSAINFKPPVILRIHNANTYLNAKKSIDPKLSFFYIWKDTSYLILHGLFKYEMFYRSKFIEERVNYFLFPSHCIRNYVIIQGYLTPRKIISPIPYVFMKDEKAIRKTNSTVNIVIIGSIDRRRRNYNEILDAFRVLIPSLKTKIVFSLLGKPYGVYGRKIIRAFRKLETNSFQVNTFTKFVSQPVFDEITQQADFLIIPTVKETRYKLYKELYGCTKISGSVNDMVIYRKPALIPAFYSIDESLKPHTKSYNSQQELTRMLENWINKRGFESYTINSVVENYDFDSVTKRTYDSLNGIINKISRFD